METVTLDLSGLKCPLPALRTRKALARLAPGAALHVICTDPMAAIDIPAMLQNQGDRLLATSRAGETLRFTIEKGSGAL